MEERPAIASRWTSKGFSCDLWTDPPGQVWEGYVHETDELVYVLEGRIELEVRGRAETLGPGREAFIPAGAVHSVRNVGGTTARWLYGYKRK
jgi:quercetin dioxygenase-like cupin family protein